MRFHRSYFWGELHQIWKLQLAEAVCSINRPFCSALLLKENSQAAPFACSRTFHKCPVSWSLPRAAQLRLDHLQQRHAQLCALLSGEDAQSLKQNEQIAFNKEVGEIQSILDDLSILRKCTQEAGDLQLLQKEETDDTELQQLVKQESGLLEAKAKKLEEAILLQLLPRDTADARDAVLEVRAGTGGDEANLFAGDLFGMYQKFCQLQGWKFEPIEMVGAEGLGGFKMASAAVTGGEGIYGLLKHESGIHRVQRVPATESQGRVHTSAASVAVLAQADELDVEMKDSDVRVDTFRASGAGGQHVNTTDSAVRLTHLPTGLMVAIQDERSQHKNKAKAMKVLRARLFEQQRLQQQRSLSAERRAQIGSGDRSERIRTYNYPQGRVTDHRVGVTEHNVGAVMNGERLFVFTEALLARERAQLLAGLGQE